MATETRKRFNEEFRAARNSGAKEFEFPAGSGKMYTTKLKDDNSSPPAKKQPQDASSEKLQKTSSVAASSEKQQIASAPFKPKSTSELSPAELKERNAKVNAQALEGSHPELLLPAGRVLSAVARPLATADKLRSTVTTGANAVKNSAPARALREAKFTKAAAKDADDIAAAGQAKEIAENAARANKFLPDEAFSFKRGGAVKMASGGMAASRRGDGIAQRGKTRGKMC